MRGRRRSDRMLVHAAGVLVLGALAWLTLAVGIRPTLAAAAEARARETEALALSTQVARERTRLLQLQRRIEAVAAELQDVPLRVQPLTALNRRYADVIELASECGILVSESRTGAARPETWFVRVPIRLEGRGPITGVAEFFRRMRVDIPDVEVLAFEVSRLGGGAEMAMSVDLAWYAASDDSSASVGR